MVGLAVVGTAVGLPSVAVGLRDVGDVVVGRKVGDHE